MNIQEIKELVSLIESTKSETIQKILTDYLAAICVKPTSAYKPSSREFVEEKWNKVA